MINRRIFFKNAGTFALGALILPSCNTKSDKSEGKDSTSTETQTTADEGKSLGAIGLQLYSIKDVLEQDLKGNLKQLADMGYKQVETYPGSKGHYYGLEPKEFSQMLKDVGMEIVSSHFGSGTPTSKAE